MLKDHIAYRQAAAALFMLAAAASCDIRSESADAPQTVSVPAPAPISRPEPIAPARTPPQKRWVDPDLSELAPRPPPSDPFAELRASDDYPRKRTPYINRFAPPAPPAAPRFDDGPSLGPTPYNPNRFSAPSGSESAAAITSPTYRYWEKAREEASVCATWGMSLDYYTHNLAERMRDIHASPYMEVVTKIPPALRSISAEDVDRIAVDGVRALAGNIEKIITLNRAINVASLQAGVGVGIGVATGILGADASSQPGVPSLAQPESPLKPMDAVGENLVGNGINAAVAAGAEITRIKGEADSALRVTQRTLERRYGGKYPAISIARLGICP